MNHSHKTAIGVAASGLALLAGQGLAQPLPNPLAPVLQVTPPKLDRIMSSPSNCQGGDVVFGQGSAYANSADLIDGPVGLLLLGSRLGDLNGIAVVLPDGRRLPALTRTDCSTAAGTSAVRVTFAVPASAVSGTARLELLAPEPRPLVRAPLPNAPAKTCTDRLTGQPTGCPELPNNSLGPKVLTIANITLNLKARPNVDSATPERIVSTGGGVTCRGRAVFRGRNLAGADIVTDAPANIEARINITGRTATTITADISRRCTGPSNIDASYFGAVQVRRGSSGAVRPISQCDTCTDRPDSSFGGASIRFSTSSPG